MAIPLEAGSSEVRDRLLDAAGEALRTALSGAAVAAGGGLWAVGALRGWSTRMLLRRDDGDA